MITIRTELRPGDLGRIISLHGALYGLEWGWDATFEAYVAETLADYARRDSPETDRIWIAEEAGEILGCIGIVGLDDGVAQLRWLLIRPRARRSGLGRRLMQAALDFCRETQRTKVVLFTVSALDAAAQLYRTTGFRLVEQRATEGWGVPVIEERYELDLR